MKQMDVLFLSPWFPLPADNGSKIRIRNLLKSLASRHTIDLISFTDRPVPPDRLMALRELCRRVDVVLLQKSTWGRIKSLAGYFSRSPRSIVASFSPAMKRCVEQATQERHYHVVVACELATARYILGVVDAARVVDDIELQVYYEQFANQIRPLARLRRGLMWGKWSSYVATLLAQVDGCTVVSEQERQLLLHAVPDRRRNDHSPLIRCVPNGLDIGEYTDDYSPPEPDSLVYFGALTYRANYDAVDYFLREIYPSIQRARPAVKFYITGSLEGVRVDRLPAPAGLNFTGHLEDVRPRVAGSWASVVPLREGAGTRLKVLESLALGTPAVSTFKGMEGLELVPGRDLLVADSPAEFASCVLHLLQDPGLRWRLSRNGGRVVRQSYDWRPIGDDFCDFVEEVVSRRHRE